MRLTLVIILATGEHGNPLQVLTGFESSPFTNGGFLFEHHACGCAKLAMVLRHAQAMCSIQTFSCTGHVPLVVNPIQ